MFPESSYFSHQYISKRLEGTIAFYFSVLIFLFCNFLCCLVFFFSFLFSIFVFRWFEFSYCFYFLFSSFSVFFSVHAMVQFVVKQRLFNFSAYFFFQFFFSIYLQRIRIFLLLFYLLFIYLLFFFLSQFLFLRSSSSTQRFVLLVCHLSL